jgi:DNA polymerase III sliding clamp (beta) subunit (PCNA family)
MSIDFIRLKAGNTQIELEFFYKKDFPIQGDNSLQAANFFDILCICTNKPQFISQLSGQSRRKILTNSVTFEAPTLKANENSLFS